MSPTPDYMAIMSMFRPENLAHVRQHIERGEHDIAIQDMRLMTGDDFASLMVGAAVHLGVDVTRRIIGATLEALEEMTAEIEESRLNMFSRVTAQHQARAAAPQN